MPDEPDFEEIRHQFDFHVEWRSHHRQVAVEATKSADAHDMVIKGLLRAYPQLSDRPPKVETSVASTVQSGEALQRGAAALESLLSSQPGVFFSSVQIHDMLVERGLAEPGPSGQSAVRTNLNRAVTTGVVKKRPLDGRSNEYAWKLPPDDLPQQLRDIVGSEYASG